jgi:hypothetical protein
LTRQSLLIVGSPRFAVLFGLRHISMDRQIKPGGDEEKGQILRVIASVAKQSSGLARKSGLFRRRPLAMTRPRTAKAHSAVSALP